jgi:hypothetical protein
LGLCGMGWDRSRETSGDAVKAELKRRKWRERIGVEDGLL